MTENIFSRNFLYNRNQTVDNVCPIENILARLLPAAAKPGTYTHKEIKRKANPLSETLIVIDVNATKTKYSVIARSGATKQSVMLLGKISWLDVRG
ncbi:MAG: hypothetical protein GXO87_04455 [Chlorobi bacterium]|nr:hypothetical protein [Chlorobiota bacterium]